MHTDPTFYVTEVNKDETIEFNDCTLDSIWTQFAEAIIAGDLHRAAKLICVLRARNYIHFRFSVLLFSKSLASTYAN